MFVKLNIDESKYEYRINFVWKPLLIRVAPFSGRKCEISWIIFSSHNLVAIPRQRKTVAVNDLRRFSTFCRIPPSLRILFNRYTFQFANYECLLVLNGNYFSFRIYNKAVGLNMTRRLQRYNFELEIGVLLLGQNTVYSISYYSFKDE